MSEKEKTYINDLAQYLNNIKREMLTKADSKEDLYERILSRILSYSTGIK